MSPIILNQHSAWSLLAADRARQDGWDLYHESADPLSVGAGLARDDLPAPAPVAPTARAGRLAQLVPFLLHHGP